MSSIKIEDIKKALTPIFTKNRVQKAILFGSFARKSQTRKSDLDLAIILETEKRFFDRYDQFNQIYWLFPDMDIDLLIYTPKEITEISHRKFIKHILNEGITLYEH